MQAALMPSADTFGLTEMDQNVYQREDPYTVEGPTPIGKYKSFNYLPELNAGGGLKSSAAQKTQKIPLKNVRSYSNLSNIRNANARRYSKMEPLGRNERNHSTLDQRRIRNETERLYQTPS
jgi:hypothetical protein